MLVQRYEERLCRTLADFPFQYNFRYTKDASQALKRVLFRFLAAEKDGYLNELFKGRFPEDGVEWSLSDAQGLTEEMEYTEAARGTPCVSKYEKGLIPSHYEEAWDRPVECAIHTAHAHINSEKQPQQSRLPEDLQACIGMTIGRALDYFIDVVSCSPENLRLPKSQESIQSDEEASRLASSVCYDETPDPNPEYALILWNDEKHTVMEVAAQVARACHQPDRFGKAKAEETNDYGRSVVEYSKNIPELLKIAEVIEQIKITVTIRSSRDTFREQMCGTIVEWLHDITGCSVGDDHAILRQTICCELLKTWRLGSEASNRNVGQDGLDDHAADSDAELAPVRLVTRVVHRRDLLATFQARAAMDDSDSDSAEDEGDEQENEQGDEQGHIQQPTPAAVTDVDQMDVDPDHNTFLNTDVDLEMRTPNDMEDGAEVSEAAFAGYPPPPPPPLAQ
ncbi:MAG: E3 ubiquitin-protein ligase ubr1 [Ramalina farinacea]|uniref:E3 ubiquitin-protein ligase n=1 Tax=Ramalina farinacea TaxID=258253 RepID=A0AA43QS37_9LECA|nr:E3 ubiquitin-protein ligase ubr1 [Ramalina farinacea]